MRVTIFYILLICIRKIIYNKVIIRWYLQNRISYNVSFYSKIINQFQSCLCILMYFIYQYTQARFLCMIQRYCKKIILYFYIKWSFTYECMIRINIAEKAPLCKVIQGFLIALRNYRLFNAQLKISITSHFALFPSKNYITFSFLQY